MIIKKIEKLTNQKWLNLFEVSYLDKAGHGKFWQMASRHKRPKCATGAFEKPDAVIIVPLHKNMNRVVVTKEYRIPLADYEYGFPAGLVDEGETVPQASRRELKEETGLDLARIIKISPPIYSSAGMTDEAVTMVYVECYGEVSTAESAASEQIEVMLLSQPEAATLCQVAELKFDAKAWLVLTRFAATGRLA